ncbi:MAG: hypothetical protein ACREQR_16625 [Candidatus Binataceae bacterium]
MKTERQRASQNVSVENDYTGVPLRRPPAEKLALLKKKGWEFRRKEDEKGRHFSFLKTCDASTLTNAGFSQKSVEWFTKGIEEAAMILKDQKKSVQE